MLTVCEKNEKIQITSGGGVFFLTHTVDVYSDCANPHSCRSMLYIHKETYARLGLTTLNTHSSSVNFIFLQSSTTQPVVPKQHL